MTNKHLSYAEAFDLIKEGDVQIREPEDDQPQTQRAKNDVSDDVPF